MRNRFSEVLRPEKKPHIRLFSPLMKEDGSVKMPMLATLALIVFLALGGLILAATCNSN